jgi:aldose sugar dehydrogenase
MTLRLIQATALLLLAACGSSPSASADRSAAPANHSSADPPFSIAQAATFDSPWAMDFVPGTTNALVTEKPGRVWLVDTATGRKQPVGGVPRVVVSSQGGLLDVVLSPHFATDKLVYLTYSEPSNNGGSGLALARARLTPTGGGSKLDGLQVIWRDP